MLAWPAPTPDGGGCSLGAETSEMQPGQEGPEGALDPPVLGEWAQEHPFMGDTDPGTQEQFLGGGGWGWGGGHTAFVVLPGGSTGQSLGPFYCSQRLHAGISESRSLASPQSGDPTRNLARGAPPRLGLLSLPGRKLDGAGIPQHRPASRGTY